MKLFLFLPLAVSFCALAQSPNTKLPPEQFRQVAARCAPRVPLTNLHAIAQTESALYPYAVSVNYPQRVAAQLGYPGSSVSLARQPRDRDQALRWMRWFQQHGYTVSVGLMQVNIENASRFGVSPEQLFDPCTNVRIGAQILSDLFAVARRSQPDPQKALVMALAAYNSGSSLSSAGAQYVHHVLVNAAPSDTR